MAANLKAGIMATTTMVGSALAYSKSQAGEGVGQSQRTSSMAGLASSTSGPPPGQQQRQQGGQTDLGGNNNYQETVNQMMHWKY